MEPLTVQQKHLAEKEHKLVYKFLNVYGLLEDEYYDVIIFGYLCAVQEYCKNPKLQKYSFSTVAWKKMYWEMKNHKKYLEREKRAIPTISLQNFKYSNNSSLFYENYIVANDGFGELEVKLLMHSLAEVLTPKTMRIIRMKHDGYPMHDIAKAERMTFKDINQLLDSTYNTVIKILL